MTVLGCALAVLGCVTNGGVPTLGSRPLIYKQGPGDAAAKSAASTSTQAASRSVSSTAPSFAPIAANSAATPAASAPAPSSTPAAAASASPPAPAARAPAHDLAAASPPAAVPAPSATPAPAAGAASAATAAAQTPGGAFATLPGALTRYTQATRYGDLLFLSGQIGIDPRNGDFAADAPVEQQARQALENIRTVLEVNGLTMANVVSVTMFVANINNLGAIDGVYGSFFKSTLPARSVAEVQRLPRGALVEISVVAGR